MAWSVREGVELFHLAFLGELGTKLDKSKYAIKGGCNLRFFFRSLRYSEDLDLDVVKVDVATLTRNVRRVLEGTSLRLTLQVAGVAIEAVSTPKQTDTTQRWKLGLRIEGSPAHTKIEFSRRGMTDESVFGSADPRLVAGYGLSPVLASHYTREAALAQKIRALVGRRESRARDVFDIDLLLSGIEQQSSDGLAVSTTDRKLAHKRALAITYDAFKSEVVAYLPAERQALYASPEIWRQMMVRVGDALSRVRS